jgi:hypothetical protein
MPDDPETHPQDDPEGYLVERDLREAIGNALCDAQDAARKTAFAAGAAYTAARSLSKGALSAAAAAKQREALQRAMADLRRLCREDELADAEQALADGDYLVAAERLGRLADRARKASVAPYRESNSTSGTTETGVTGGVRPRADAPAVSKDRLPMSVRDVVARALTLLGSRTTPLSVNALLPEVNVDTLRILDHERYIEVRIPSIDKHRWFSPNHDGGWVAEVGGDQWPPITHDYADEAEVRLTPSGRAALAELKVAETAAPTAAEQGQSNATAPPAPPSVDNDSHLSPTRLAKLFKVPSDALRKRLDSWRAKNHTGWIENPERAPREAKYLYRVGSICSVIAALKASSETGSERPARKN